MIYLPFMWIRLQAQYGRTPAASPFSAFFAFERARVMLTYSCFAPGKTKSKSNAE